MRLNRGDVQMASAMELRISSSSLRSVASTRAGSAATPGRPGVRGIEVPTVKRLPLHGQ